MTIGGIVILLGLMTGIIYSYTIKAKEEQLDFYPELATPLKMKKAMMKTNKKEFFLPIEYLENS